MLRISVLVLCTALVLVASCHPGPARPDPASAMGPKTAPSGVAPAAGSSPSVHAPATAHSAPTDEPYLGPPHHFMPRSHAPRAHHPPPAPKLSALPALISRHRKCFAPPPAAGGTGLGSVGTIGHGAGTGTGQGFGSGHGRLGGSHMWGGRPPRVRMGATSVGGRAAPPARRRQPPPSSPPAADPTIGSPPGGPGYHGWGASIYLSNDDSMSLSSAQRIQYAIDHFLPVPASHIRPHELLNYFSFQTEPVDQGDDFSVQASIDVDPDRPGGHTLALAMQGRMLDKSSRRNTALTLVLDRSGSMRDEGRLDFLKRGLHRMLAELKRGDLVHMVVFDHEVCVPVQNFAVGRDPMAVLEKAIDALEPRGSTDLHKGLTRGYDIADKTLVPGHSNRVMLITDALANTGVTSKRLIAAVGKHYDLKRIRLSGVGVGRRFQDSLLDRLTERGRGAYVFLGSGESVDELFGPRFVSLIETTAVDVHFRLHLPPSLRMQTFYGEESSTERRDVQAIHYFGNTSQLFLADLVARGDAFRPQDQIMLTIEYRDPATERPLVQELAFTLGAIRASSPNVQKARLVMGWVDGLAQVAARSTPRGWRRTASSWVDAEGYRICSDVRRELVALGAGLDDPDGPRIIGLWDKYCSRYERPRTPARRHPAGVRASP